MENIIFSALIAGMVEVAKRLGMPKKYAYPLAVVVGIAVQFLTPYSYGQMILQGLAIGLGAVGLYEGAKKLPGAEKVLKIG